MHLRPGLLRARLLGLLGSVVLAPVWVGADARGAPAGRPDPESVSTSEPEPASEPESESPLPRSQEDDPENLETPIFPQVRYRDALRVRVESGFLPNNDFGSVDVSLYSPAARVRLTVPLGDRAVLQFTGRIEYSHYDFSGTSDLFGTGPTTGDPLDGLYSSRLAIQGAYRLNQERSLIVAGEAWSLLANASARSRWEQGRFGKGLTGGGTLALGYQNAKVRIALGVRLENETTGGGVRVDPVATIRWDPTERITVRNRGRGGQIEVQLTPSITAFAAGYVKSRSYRLANRAGVPDDAVLRDRMVLVGTGFEWRINRRFRVNLEAGVVASREIRVRSNGTKLSLMRADPGGYLTVRVTVRP